MRILIACESSGTVRKEFEKRGHFARSVDLLPTEQMSQQVRYRGRSRFRMPEGFQFYKSKAKGDRPPFGIVLLTWERVT